MPQLETITSAASPEEIEGRLDQLRARDRAKAAPRPSRAKERRRTKVFNPLFDCDRPLRVRGERERQKADEKHRETWPAKYPSASLAPDSIELMPDETMVTATGREGRILIIDQLERAWRGTKKRTGWLPTDLYRIARQIQADLESTKAYGIVALDLRVDGGGEAPEADNNADACRRLAKAERQTGYKRAWRALEMFLADKSLRDIERHLCVRNGEGRRGVVEALDRIDRARIYETLRWRTPTWAAREQEMAA